LFIINSVIKLNIGHILAHWAHIISSTATNDYISASAISTQPLDEPR